MRSADGGVACAGLAAASASLRRRHAALAAFCLAVSGGGARADPVPSAGAPAPAAPRTVTGIDAVRGLVSTPLHVDLDGLLARGMVRVAVTYSKTHYFVDRGRQHGLAYEALAEFERFLRRRHARKRGRKPVTVVFMPVPRDELFARLQDGRADLAVANLTVTPERRAVADFTVPLLSGAREVVVTQAGSPALASVEDLSGREVVVRGSSSFREHLEASNARLTAAGKAPVRLVRADEHLETEDLLEMVNAGLVEATVADEHVVRVWEEIFPRLQVHRNAAVAENGTIAWAVRKDAPGLLSEANAFVATHRFGTAFGNVLRKRYLQDTRWVRRAMDEGELRKFQELLDLFRRYGDRYGFDHLMLLAQAYQESGLDQARRSPVGAIGIMQLLPTTGAAMRVGDIRELEPNVHAGAKYLRTILEQYFSDPAIGDMDRVLFGFAAYNAGPNRIQSLRRRAARSGLDPNVWFGNVEAVAAEVLGLETVHYVSNVSKYYLAYRMVESRRRERSAAEAAVE
jgi:membrane-bound lytic murein transglycosylase MltF